MATPHIFKCAKDVWTYVSTFRSQFPLCNAFVLHLHLNNKNIVKDTASELSTLLNISVTPALKLKIGKLYKEVCTLNKSLNSVSTSEKVFHLLNSEFALPSHGHKPGEDIIVNALQEVPVNLLDQSTSLPPSPVKNVVRGCENCQKLKADNSKTVDQLLSKLKNVKKECRDLAKFYNTRRINQQRKRLSSTIFSLRRKVASLGKEKRKLKARLEGKGKQKLSKENTLLKRKLSIASSTVDDERRANKCLRTEVKALEQQLILQESSDSSSELDASSKPRIISDTIRKCVYFCLTRNVSVEAVGKIIEYVGTCLGQEISHVPHSSTVSRCAYELACLCDVQCAEFMLNANSLTLAWDATTVQGTHINCVVVSSEECDMAITTDVLPGGKAEDYADHLVNTVTKIAAVYAKYTDSDATTVLNSIVQKFRCTMTDRASVNHCAAVRLMNKLQINLLELNCQMHPLETFASAARDALLAHEKASSSSRSQTFGQTSGAVNIVSALSKLRYKDGKGDPCGFIAFIKEDSIDSRLMIRYVGNRLHALFHLGGSIFFLKDKLMSYLKRCSQQKLRLALIADLSNSLFITHLQVLGLFGKVVTGPWMTVIYSKAKEKDHMGKTLKVLKCIDFVGDIAKCPELLINSSVDGFGRELLMDDVLCALRSSAVTPSFSEAASMVASKVHERLERQLKKYREDPAYCPTDETVRELTASASVHNMVCERNLGMVDSHMRRSPNASINSIEAKVRAQINGTVNWLESSSNQSILFAFARKQGASSRKQQRKEKAVIDEKILKRQREKGQEREMAARKQKEKEVQQAIDGGVVSTILEDVEESIISFINDVVASKFCGVFRHIWASSDGQDQVFWGILRKYPKRKKNGPSKVTVGYWHEAETEAEAVDYELTVHSLVTDAILGDIML